MRTLLIATLMIAGCGSGPSQNTKYELQGECDPTAGATAIKPLRTADWSCNNSTRVFDVIDSQARLDAMGVNCSLSDGKTVDFASERVVLVSGEGGNGGRTTVNFLVDNGSQVELGLTYVPSGFRDSDFALVIPISTHPLVVRQCNQVCVSGCDFAIP